MMDTCLLVAPVTIAEPSYTGGLHRGEVAQLVEHTAENRGVAGSSPALAMSSQADLLSKADFASRSPDAPSRGCLPREGRD